MEALLKQLKSKKLIVAILTAVGIVINDALGSPISQDAMYSAIAVLATYIVGQGISDAGKEKKKIEVANLPNGKPNWEDTTEVDAVDGAE